ncbi:hypothetical protein [Dictyobacter kobayashii]|uniref:Peptidase M48 domain-containing protein n=1 Tax=Dictyobacter kobayashii TaxID=2014872 RepID=A0A402APY1_9CHLR|nr:hypothetical protein [Dictyobacter kobayashii]GCE21176.1 hypothetical protein KDK_49760 [Dictyobacter kobayashii]
MTHNSFDNSPKQQPVSDLEQLLTDYYGPPLEEQPLSATSWMHVQQQLSRQRRWSASSWLARGRRPARPVPFYLQEALSNVVREAHIQSRVPHPRLRYHPRRRRMLPTTSVSLWWPSAIHVTANRSFERILDQNELDVVLASGLARYLYYLKPGQRIVSWLCTLLALVASFSLVVMAWRQSFSWLFWLALAVTLSSLVLLGWHKCRLAFLADAEVAHWLGRERTCQGLHGLMARSAHPRRAGWGEPSLAARARRVCNLPVSLDIERLTTAR